ncbi:hypothetical protein ACIOD1_33085 [Streptomyces sp. NPDC088097]|uniref:hypothetical protein n=1 Tax=Streptomyces sp. NPDC088097 TaxID=3365823 RepID=UPI00380398CB
MKITCYKELSMRSRTVANAALLAASLMGVGMGSAHADGIAPISTPYTAGAWGNTSYSGSSSGSTTTWDDEVQAGTASNFGQEVTNYGSVATDYANQAAASNTIGGSQTQYTAG